MVEKFAALKKHLLQEVSSQGSICMVTHSNPDGDGLAACLALQDILVARGVHSDIVLEYPAPELYEYLDGPARATTYEDFMQYDLVILVDCHEQKRIGRCAPLIDRAKSLIAIDHHTPGEIIPEAYTCIETEIVSAGGIIFRMFEDDIAGMKNRNRIVTAIYTTVINDTDNFQNSNTNADTFEICARLADLGLHAGETVRLFVWSKTAAEMRLVGEVLSTIEMLHDGDILFMHSTIEMLRQNMLNGEATSKMTRWVKGTKGAKAIVYFRQVEDETWRLSLRSEFVDVAVIARSHNGGGHVRAAGCTMHGTLSQVQREIQAEIEKQL